MHSRFLDAHVTPYPDLEAVLNRCIKEIYKIATGDTNSGYLAIFIVINPKLFIVIWLVVTIIRVIGKKAVGFVSG